MKQTLFPNTPSITVEAEDPEMEQLAFEIASALDAGKVAGSAYLARYRDAGEKLLKVRKLIKHGKWIAWLTRHNINRMTAFRAIKAYSKCNSVTFLDDAIGEMAEGKEEQEKLPEGESSPPATRAYCGRNCRIGIGPSDCKVCAKLNKPTPANRGPNLQGKVTAPEAPSAPGTPPEPAGPIASVEEVMGQAPTYEKLAKSLRIVSKKIRKLERSEIHRRLTGRTSEKLADSALDISKTLEKTAPKAPCAACGGVVNLDAEPCKGCKGKGVLTAAEVIAEKERLNY